MASAWTSQASRAIMKLLSPAEAARVPVLLGTVGLARYLRSAGPSTLTVTLEPGPTQQLPCSPRLPLPPASVHACWPPRQHGQVDGKEVLVCSIASGFAADGPAFPLPINGRSLHCLLDLRFFQPMCSSLSTLTGAHQSLLDGCA